MLHVGEQGKKSLPRHIPELTSLNKKLICTYYKKDSGGNF